MQINERFFVECTWLIAVAVSQQGRNHICQIEIGRKLCFSKLFYALNPISWLALDSFMIVEEAAKVFCQYELRDAFA